MGIFQNIFSKPTTSAPEVIHSEELEQYKINLNKTTINLTKSTGVQFDNLKSKVKLVLDYSGSMSDLYSIGTVQKVINKILPLALKFDDDGELDCYLFSNGCKTIQSCTEINYRNYVTNIVQKAGFRMGGTEYAPVLKKIHESDTKNIPTFTIFITDGDNSDKPETDNIVRAMSTDNGFVMFIGIGNDDFKYLSKLDNLSGRPIDNTGFTVFSNIRTVDENTLYTMLLTEYAAWLKR